LESATEELNDELDLLGVEFLSLVGEVPQPGEIVRQFVLRRLVRAGFLLDQDAEAFQVFGYFGLAAADFIQDSFWHV
jgi:hypothetical protein